MKNINYLHQLVYDLLIATYYSIDKNKLNIILKKELSNHIAINIQQHINRWFKLLQIYIVYLFIIFISNNLFLIYLSAIPFLLLIIYHYYIDIKIRTLIERIQPILIKERIIT